MESGSCQAGVFLQTIDLLPARREYLDSVIEESSKNI
jgi:hypothetical protein